MPACVWRHPDRSASFDAPTFVDDLSIPVWLPAWDLLTGQADNNCLPSLRDTHHGPAKYIWRLHVGWQSRLLMWVENRMDRVTGHTLLTARGVADRLSSLSARMAVRERASRSLGTTRRMKLGHGICT